MPIHLEVNECDLDGTQAEDSHDVRCSNQFSRRQATVMIPARRNPPALSSYVLPTSQLLCDSGASAARAQHSGVDRVEPDRGD